MIYNGLPIHIRGLGKIYKGDEEIASVDCNLSKEQRAKTNRTMGKTYHVLLRPIYTGSISVLDGETHLIGIDNLYLVINDIPKMKIIITRQSTGGIYNIKGFIED